MAWGSTPFGSLPSEGGVATVQAHPLAQGSASAGAYKVLAIHPRGVSRVQGGDLRLYVTSAEAVDAITVLMTVSPTLAEPVTFTVSGPGNPVVLGYVLQLDGSFLVTVLGLIPGEDYVIMAASGYNEAPAPFTALIAQAGTGYKIIEAITYAAGKQMQELAGQPACRLKADLDIYATVVYVTSTLGFPQRGWLRVGSLLLEYLSKTSQSFTLREAALRYPLIAQGARVTLAVDMVTPDGAGFGTGNF